jgi:uncharacterized protein (TIGR00297 family)
VTVAGTLLVGGMLATGVALVARRVESLSTSGAVAAAVIGTIAVVAGWSWAVVLIVYFVSASLLSRFRRDAKTQRAGDRIEKAGARDAVQVLANGGAYAAMALGYIVRPDVTWQALAAGALAASAADTWATETGLLARQRPRSIVSAKVVEPGTSGGVTVVGFVGAALGATVIGAAAALVRWPPVALLAALVGGILGCVVDSLVGATLQSRRWCDRCRVETEQRFHRCGAATKPAGGVAWLDNDAVNAVATLSGALLGAATAFLLTHDA